MPFCEFPNLCWKEAVLLLVLIAPSYTLRDFTCSTPDEWIDIENENDEIDMSEKSGHKQDRRRMWPGRVVPYDLDNNLTPKDKNHIYAAISEYHTKTCIRFQEKTQSDKYFVHIYLNKTRCGKASTCLRKTRRNYASFGLHCRDKREMIHELGHTLCLHHEHQRLDRDSYLTFGDCTKISEKTTKPRGFYDYSSQMHYPCWTCRSGWPKSRYVIKCGPHTSTGLSVLDADKINRLYNCKGCLRHRWMPRYKLSEEMAQNIPTFSLNNLNKPVYPCRGIYQESLVVGSTRSKFGADWCHVVFKNVKNVQTDILDYEVFTIPENLGNIDSEYKLVKVNTSWDKTELDRIFQNAVVGGRLGYASGSEGTILYIGYAEIGNGELCPYWSQSSEESLEIGSIAKYKDGYKAYFHSCGFVTPDVFYVLSCVSEIKKDESHVDSSAFILNGRFVSDFNRVYIRKIGPFGNDSLVRILGQIETNATEARIELLGTLDKAVRAPIFFHMLFRNHVNSTEIEIRKKAFLIEQRKIAVEINCRAAHVEISVEKFTTPIRYDFPPERIKYLRIYGYAVNTSLDG